jgi:hypothetical protein
MRILEWFKKASDREGHLEKSELTKNCAIYTEPLV